MGGINLLGHEENGNEKKRETAKAFELTKPTNGKSSSPVTRDGAVTYVRELLDTHRTPSSSPVPPPPPRQPLPRPQAQTPRPLANETPTPTPKPAPSRPPVFRPMAPPPLPKTKSRPAPSFSSPSNGAWNGGSDGAAGVDVNLILEREDDDHTRIKRVRWLVVAFLGSVVLVGLAYAALLFYQSRLISETNALDATLAAQLAEIRSFAASRGRASRLNQRVTAVSKLLDQHPRWTNVFEIIEDYTLPAVYYENMSATTDGHLSLTAYAPNYAGVVDQLRVFENHPDIFTAVSIQNAESAAVNFDVTKEDGTVETATVPKVTFGVELTIDPKRIVQGNP